MSALRRIAVSTSVAALALTGLAAASTAPAAAAPTPRDLVNKTDGSRLALYGNSKAEGATAISLRSPSWKYDTEEWTVSTGGGQSDGTYNKTIKNTAANKCLQPSSATAGRGTTIVVKTCDGSDLQTWNLKPQKVGGSNTGWWMWRPAVNKKVALTLNRYNDGSWDTLHLDTAYDSSDRLWRIQNNDEAR